MQKGLTTLSAITAALVFSALSVQAAPVKSMEKMKSLEDSPVYSYYDYSDVADNESLSYMKESVNTALESHKERMREAPKNVVDAFRYTLKAVVAMQDNNIEVAKESLNASAKLFSIALLDEPNLDLVPVADEVDASALDASPGQIDNILKNVQSKLSQHQTQSARVMLMPLVDQVSVTTEFLPMKLYPQAIEKSYKQLKAGQTDKALQTLENAFSVIVTQNEILPLPLIRADSYSEAASKLSLKERKKALILLNMAQRELKKAILLGYAGQDSSDYKEIQNKIDAVKSTINKGEKSKSVFSELKNEFDKLLSKKENSLHQTSMSTGS